MDNFDVSGFDILRILLLLVIIKCFSKYRNIQWCLDDIIIINDHYRYLYKFDMYIYIYVYICNILVT